MFLPTGSMPPAILDDFSGVRTNRILNVGGGRGERRKEKEVGQSPAIHSDSFLLPPPPTFSMSVVLTPEKSSKIAGGIDPIGTNIKIGSSFSAGLFSAGFLHVSVWERCLRQGHGVFAGF
jgi:hypothetical protein